MLGEVGGPLLAGPRRRHRRVRVNPRLERIGVSSWSFHNDFATTEKNPDQEQRGSIALLDFPEMIADRFKVHHVEFVAPHFGSMEPTYIQELRDRLSRAHSHLENICVDIEELRTEGGLSDPQDTVRDRAVQASKSWIDVASRLRARSIRCDAGRLNLQNLEPTIDSYRELAAYGQPKGVRVIVENHGGVGSEHPEDLVALFKKVNSPYFGALPDFGNFPDEQIRERGLALLFPYALTVCHAKGLKFDAQGDETEFDFPACMAIAKRAKFRGIYSIEYEGPGDPYEGVQNVINELLKSQ
jgi:sugar phosphate isomerase/epimerase